MEDETVGTLHFAEEFEKRYGPNHPQFYTGTLEEAIQEACGKPPKDVSNLNNIFRNYLNNYILFKSIYLINYF